MDPHTQQPMQQPVQPQGQFNQPPHMQPPHTPQENPGQTLSIVSLVLGIIGILSACSLIFFYVGIPLGIAGLVCGIIGRNKTPQGMKAGLAVAGIIVGAVAIVMAIVVGGVMTLGILAEIGTPGTDMYYLFSDF